MFLKIIIRLPTTPGPSRTWERICFLLATIVLMINTQLILLCVCVEKCQNVKVMSCSHLFVHDLSMQMTTKQTSQSFLSTKLICQKNVCDDLDGSNLKYLFSMYRSQHGPEEKYEFSMKFVKVLRKTNIFDYKTALVRETGTFRLRKWSYFWEPILSGCTFNAHNIPVANIPVYENRSSPVGT